VPAKNHAGTTAAAPLSAESAKLCLQVPATQLILGDLAVRAETSVTLNSGSWLVDVFSLLSNETEIKLPELAPKRCRNCLCAAQPILHCLGYVHINEVALRCWNHDPAAYFRAQRRSIAVGDRALHPCFATSYTSKVPEVVTPLMFSRTVVLLTLELVNPAGRGVRS
jgi:hypothetical protein